MTAAACAALGVSRATVQRRRAGLAAPPAIPRPRPRPARALSAPQRQEVLDVLHAPDFADQAPAEVYATLLDQGIFLCSIRTMYPFLTQHDEVRERRAQLRHPVYQKPELLAEGPNQVWSWDITKLMGPAKWTYFYLYASSSTSSAAAWSAGVWPTWKAPSCSGRCWTARSQIIKCHPVNSLYTRIVAGR